MVSLEAYEGMASRDPVAAPTAFCRYRCTAHADVLRSIEALQQIARHCVSLFSPAPIRVSQQVRTRSDMRSDAAATHRGPILYPVGTISAAPQR